MRPPLKSQSPAQSANGAVSVAPRPVTAECAAAVPRGHGEDVVGDVLPQRRRRAEQHLQSAEKMLAQSAVFLQRAAPAVVSFRHVEVRGDRKLAQVADVVSNAPGIGLPSSM